MSTDLRILITIGVAPDAKLPPVDVVVEVLAAFALAVLSALALLPPLKPIRLAAALSPELLDAAFHCPDFAVVQHRGRALAARRRAATKTAERGSS